MCALARPLARSLARSLLHPSVHPSVRSSGWVRTRMTACLRARARVRMRGHVQGGDPMMRLPFTLLSIPPSATPCVRVLYSYGLYIVMIYIVMANIVMAYIVMAYIVLTLGKTVRACAGACPSVRPCVHP